jgi:hypothetical protein
MAFASATQPEAGTSSAAVTEVGVPVQTASVQPERAAVGTPTRFRRAGCHWHCSGGPGLLPVCVFDAVLRCAQKALLA